MSLFVLYSMYCKSCVLLTEELLREIVGFVFWCGIGMDESIRPVLDFD